MAGRQVSYPSIARWALPVRKFEPANRNGREDKPIREAGKPRVLLPKTGNQFSKDCHFGIRGEIMNF